MRRVHVRENLLRNLYINQHLTTYQIAEKLGFCQGTIWKRLKEYQIKTRLSYIPASLTREQLSKWYLDRKLSTWEIEKKFGYPRGTIYRKLKEFGLNTRNIASSHIRFSRQDFSGDILEKAYLVGFRIGDLNITKCGPQSETIVTKCGSTKKGQIRLFRDLFSHYGHILQGKLTKEGKINIQVNLNLTFSFLLAKNPNSYQWVFNNKDTFFSFLAGFSDAEGSFFISEDKAVFALGNYNKILLAKIRKKLFELGIETPELSIYHSKGLRSSNGYINNGDYFTLHCSRKKYLLRILEEFKQYLKHPDKLKTMEKSLQNIIDRNKKYGDLRMA